MRIGLFTMPSHPPERSLYDGVQWDLAVLRWGDELGYQEAWLGEHHIAPWEPNPAPDLVIAQALLQTRRIRLGPGGFLLPFHHPAQIANRVALLDHLSQGRFNFGVAAGQVKGDLLLFNVDGKSGQNREMVRESLEIILRLWQEDGPFTHEGKVLDGAQAGALRRDPLAAPRPGAATVPADRPVGREPRLRDAPDGRGVRLLADEPGDERRGDSGTLALRGGGRPPLRPLPLPRRLAHHPGRLRGGVRRRGRAARPRRDARRDLGPLRPQALPAAQPRQLPEARPDRARRGRHRRILRPASLADGLARNRRPEAPRARTSASAASGCCSCKSTTTATRRTPGIARCVCSPRRSCRASATSSLRASCGHDWRAIAADLGRDLRPSRWDDTW